MIIYQLKNIIPLSVASFQHIDPIAAFSEGREEGFDYYFKSWYKQFCFFAFNYTKDQTVSEDIVSDCFIKVWSKRERFTNESMLKSYCYTAISNASKNWIRDKKRLLKRQIDFKAQIQTIEISHLHNIINAETMHLLIEAINELPDRCRLVFVKNYIEEKSHEQIAKEMNTSVSTVNNQKARGIKLLKFKILSDL